LCAAECDIVGRIARGDAILLDRLSKGIQSVADDYDVVILDPPFTPGMISLCVLRASNALLIPVQPSGKGFASTTAFLAMLHDSMLALESHGYPVQLNWFKFLLSRTNDQNSMYREIASGMRNIYGGNHCLAAMIDSAEIDNASARSMTVYDLDNPATSRIAHNRAVTHLNAVNREIEIEIRKTWPSHAKRLAKEGIV
jgi:chromosome partitioning protein